MNDKWRDLRPRVLSALVMLALAIGAALAGPFWFAVLIAVVTGLMVWELMRMHAPRFAQLAEIGAALSVAAVYFLYPFYLSIYVQLGLAATVGVALLLTVCVKRGLVFFAPYVLMILLTGIVLAAQFWAAPVKIAFLLLIVIATDVAGYFAGKSIGGRKFWPRVSPKKTWSGVIAGWIAAGGVGAIGVALGHFGPLFIAIAMIMSFGSQMGDIAESALKRRAGVKDSSNLIPGHGGVLDRFDGVVGATVVLFVTMVL